METGASSMIHKSVAAVLLLGAALAAPAQAAPLQTAQEISDCSRANLPSKTSVQSIELTAIDREQNKRKLDSTLYWKKMPDGLSRVMMYIRSPNDLSGSSYLVIGKAGADDDMYVYLPGVQRTRKITGQTQSKSLWNTDFSYEDLKQLQGVAPEGEMNRLADAEESGRAVYVLSFKPTAGNSAYEEIKASVDQESCLPLRVEFYEPGARLRKVMTIDAVTASQLSDKRWVPRDIAMSDQLNGTSTTVKIKSIRYDDSVADSAFNPLSFYRTAGR